MKSIQQLKPNSRLYYYDISSIIIQRFKAKLLLSDNAICEMSGRYMYIYVQSWKLQLPLNTWNVTI